MIISLSSFIKVTLEIIKFEFLVLVIIFQFNFGVVTAIENRFFIL